MDKPKKISEVLSLMVVDNLVKLWFQIWTFILKNTWAYG